MNGNVAWLTDTHSREDMQGYFLEAVVSLHGYSVDISSDRYSTFMDHLWTYLPIMNNMRGLYTVTPLDRITNVPINTDMAATNDFLKTIKNAKRNDAARAHIIKAQERQKKGYDGLREELSFKMGDLVKLSTKDTPIEKGPAYKLKPRYVGPLEVLKVVSPVAYRITLSENWRIHNVLHVSRLRPWHEATEVRTKQAG